MNFGSLQWNVVRLRQVVSMPNHGGARPRDCLRMHVWTTLSVAVGSEPTLATVIRATGDFDTLLGFVAPPHGLSLPTAIGAGRYTTVVDPCVVMPCLG